MYFFPIQPCFNRHCLSGDTEWIGPSRSFLKLRCREETRTSVVKMRRADGKLELEDEEEGWEVIWSGGGIASMNSKQLW